MVLSSTAYEAAVGESFTVTVSAPGAKSVQLIDIDHGNIVVKERASDNLDIDLSSAGPAVFHLVGLAFFDGSEEGIRSNEIYVTVSDNITPGQANDPVLGGWKLYSYTSLIDGQPDMPNCFFENDNNFRNSPLGADRLELIFMGNQVYKALTLDGKINVETGTWKKENSNYYITYDSGETEGPYYLLNDDNGLAIKIPGEGNKAAHIQFNRMEMTEEKFNEILAALDGNN